MCFADVVEVCTVFILSCCLQEENEDESTKNLPPWKLELMKKKQQPRLAPKPKPSKPPPATSKAEKIPK